MAGLAVRNVASPEETRPFAGHGHADVLTLDGHPVLYGTFEPGWRWSQDVKPLAGTNSCQAPHMLYCLQGRMTVAMDDGTRAEIGPGDVARIEPGHDAWVDGDEACVMVDFGGYARYAQSHAH